MAIEAWFNCRDILSSIEFYTQKLDFRVVVAPGREPGDYNSRHAILSREGDFLHLDSHARDSGAFGAQIYVRVSNVDAICEKFLQKGLVLNVPAFGNTPIDQTWGMREFGLRDPDGNRLTFGQPIA